jgi:hypothetical protein
MQDHLGMDSHVRRRLAWLGAAALCAAFAVAALPGAAPAHDPEIVLRAFGTPAIEGLRAAGEWDTAARRDFAVNRLASEGGGTVPATLYEMNDGTNLYLGVQVARATVANSSVAFEFDNDHDGAWPAEGDDILLINPAIGFFDEYRTMKPPCPTNSVCGLLDTDTGGTSDGAGLASAVGPLSFYEFRHPLDSADAAHDFSLHVGNRVGFVVQFRTCDTTTCADTSYPSGNPSGDIVVTSLNKTPPETEITSGPASNSYTRATASFAFTGRDDQISPADLSFECSLDGGVYATCSSPKRFDPLAAGRHSFAVRAIDEAGNIDPSPVVRRWTVDTGEPETDIASGPADDSYNSAAGVDFAFVGRDDVAAADQLVFECDVDGGGWGPCTSPKHYDGLADGRHTFAVRAVDPAANVDETPATRAWAVDTTAPVAPGVVGPRRTSSPRPRYRLVSHDDGTPGTQLRYRCAFDSRRLRPCESRFGRSLTLGRHVLRARALDLAGNESRSASVRILVVSSASHRQGPHQ